MTAAWGEGGSTADEGDEVLPNGGRIDLGGGHMLQLNEKTYRALLHRAETVRALAQRAQDICDLANAQVAMPPEEVERLGKGQPAYKVAVYNFSNATRARARVFPANKLGHEDDAIHQTLYKSWLAHPSDPIPGAESALDGPDTRDHSSGTGSVEVFE